MTLKFPIFISWEFLKSLSAIYLVAALIWILVVIFFLKGFLTDLIQSYLLKKRNQMLKKLLKEKYISNVKNLSWEDKLQKALLFLDLINEEALDLKQISNLLKLSPEATAQLHSFWESQKITPDALDEIITKLEILLLTKN